MGSASGSHSDGQAAQSHDRTSRPPTRDFLSGAADDRSRTARSCSLAVAARPSSKVAIYEPACSAARRKQQSGRRRLVRGRSACLDSLVAAGAVMACMGSIHPPDFPVQPRRSRSCVGSGRLAGGSPGGTANQQPVAEAGPLGRRRRVNHCLAERTFRRRRVHRSEDACQAGGGARPRPPDGLARMVAGVVGGRVIDREASPEAPRCRIAVAIFPSASSALAQAPLSTQRRPR